MDRDLCNHGCRVPPRVGLRPGVRSKDLTRYWFHARSAGHAITVSRTQAADSIT
jgi:hypothetical protein